VALGLVLFVIGVMVAYSASEMVRFRIHGWLYPWSDVNGAYYQIVRALDAVRTGGITGTGFGRGTPYEIPLSHSDFIFPAIANEWGKFGAVGLIVLTVIIVQRIAIIGYSRRRGSYTQLLMHGVAVFIAVQAFVNITGVIRLLPLTGVPLPLVSYGGSAMVVVFFGLGLVYGGHTSDI
jgi:cell division protein FtsW (lipid II flippase)